MNLIDNGVEKFISYEKIDDGERLGYEVVFIDYYGKTCKRLVNNMDSVMDYQNLEVQWME